MSVQTILDKIKNGVYGKDVRQAIHDGIEKVYEDAAMSGNANMEVARARGTFDNLDQRLTTTDDILENTSGLLADKVGGGKKAEPEDFSERSIALITGQGTINLESIPQDDSVSYSKLDNNLRDGLTIPVNKVITNGDFSNGTTGYTAYESNNSIVAGNLINKTNGNTAFSSVIQTSNYALTKNHKIYIETKVRVTNTDSTSLKMTVRGSVVSDDVTIGEVLNPTANQWYVLKGFLTVGTQTGTLKTYVSHYYAAGAAGKDMEIEYITAVDTSEILGVGKEPTQEEVETFLSKFPKRWFNETVSFFSLKDLLVGGSSSGLDDYLIGENETWGVI